MHNGASHIQAVVFDIGGVLLEYDFDRAVRAAAPVAGLPVEEVRHRLFGDHGYASMQRDEVVARFECGHVSPRDFHACVEKLLNCRLPFGFFREAWNSIFIEEIGPTVRLMRELLRRSGLSVAMLSNTNALHLEYIRGRWRMFQEVPHVFASNEIRARKPDAAAYQHVLRTLGVPAGRAVFVDDLIENVRGAEAVGMLAVHGRDPATVRAGLGALGLCAPEPVR
jgi:putative hydrolase of the HAD superfamily